MRGSRGVGDRGYGPRWKITSGYISFLKNTGTDTPEKQMDPLREVRTALCEIS